MPTVQEMIDVRAWATDQADVGLPTGLRDLDALTHGLRPGQLWLLAGTPGVGRTVLAGQIALHAALERRGSVIFLSGREPARIILSNMVCALGRVSPHQLAAGLADEQDQAHLETAFERLSAVNLRFWSMTDDRWDTDQSQGTPDLTRMIGRHKPARVLVVDDLDSVIDEHALDVLPRLREWCRTADFTLLATMPEELLLEQERLLPRVRREVDVALRLSRADQFDATSPRPGEAHLQVLSHRAGPTTTLLLGFQGFFRRFVDG